ncbi:MAG: dihydrodipicolinate synthase family protein, partial [Rhodospirillaceae bacterium]|nr:dihydrodipicolinate synthase family protein [Rhodospirillaceae bacterium]
AARCGADFAMTKELTRTDLHGFFSRIAERIPVMLYDQTNEGTLDVDGEVLPLVDAIERIMAVKVSGNVYSFHRLKDAAPQATCICGWDAFSLPAYVSGADGVVAGSAAVMPDREVELHRLVQAGGWDEARHLFYQRMLPMIAYCTPDPYAFSVCKHILHWKGLFDSPVVRPPYENVPPWLQRELRVLAQQLGLLEGV